MKNKYGEPWADGQYCGVQMLVSKADGQHIVMHSEMRERIAKCVNACAGMDDPVMEVQRLKNKVAAAMLDPVVSEKIESLYTSSPETLQKAIQEAKDDGFNVEFNSQMVYAHKPVTTPSWSDLDFYGYPAPNKELKTAVEHSETEGFGGIVNNPIKINIDTREYLIPNKAGTTKPNPDDIAKFVTDACNAQSKNVLDRVGEKSLREKGELPPVGWHGECTYGSKSIWHECLILPRNKIYIFCSSWERIGTITDSFEFRPIQTEKQKTIKSMLECFDNFFSDGGPTDNVGDVCEKIYDKFIAKK